MTIDAADYEPIAPDDLSVAFVDVAQASLRERETVNDFAFCHQLGCNFSELPHG